MYVIRGICTSLSSDAHDTLALHTLLAYSPLHDTSCRVTLACHMWHAQLAQAELVWCSLCNFFLFFFFEKEVVVVPHGAPHQPQQNANSTDIFEYATHGDLTAYAVLSLRCWAVQLRLLCSEHFASPICRRHFDVSTSTPWFWGTTWNLEIMVEVSTSISWTWSGFDWVWSSCTS